MNDTGLGKDVLEGDVSEGDTRVGVVGVEGEGVRALKLIDGFAAGNLPIVGARVFEVILDGVVNPEMNLGEGSHVHDVGQ